MGIPFLHAMPTIPHFNRHGLQSVLFTGSSIIRSFLSWEEEQGYLHLCCRSDNGPPAQVIWGQQWQKVEEGGTSGPSWFPNTFQLLTPPRVMTLVNPATWYLQPIFQWYPKTTANMTLVTCRVNINSGIRDSTSWKKMSDQTCWNFLALNEQFWELLR